MEAGNNFQAATEVGPQDDATEEQNAWRYYLVARAMAGNKVAYRAACTALLAKRGGIDNPDNSSGGPPSAPAASTTSPN